MLNQEEFFKKYNIQNYFKESGLDWDTLSDIYDDFIKEQDTLKVIAAVLQNEIKESINKPVHSVYSRVKDPLHLIEKIIRKCGYEHSKKYQSINVSNYKEIVHDLIGVRILLWSKEEWTNAYEVLVSHFPSEVTAEIRMAEVPIAYTRYGDRDIYGDKIKQEHSNKGYRSQHYIVYYKNSYAEIQVRTLAEEVYGEFDHRVKYPYRTDNNFLKRYTNTMSQLLDAVDELISTCHQFGESGWEQSQKYFEEDIFRDWAQSKPEEKTEKTDPIENAATDEEESVISIATYAKEFLRGRK